MSDGINGHYTCKHDNEKQSCLACRLEEIAHLRQQLAAERAARERAEGERDELFELTKKAIDDFGADIPRIEQLVADRDAALARAEAAERRLTAPIVCMCGSTRFKQAWISENARLTGEGNIVLAVGLWGHHERVFPSDEEKARLDDLHKRKIDLCDWVWVLDIGGYIGESTRSEIAYAEQLGKPIRYLSQEFPDYVEPVDEWKSRAEAAEQQAEALRAALGRAMETLQFISIQSCERSQRVHHGGNEHDSPCRISGDCTTGFCLPCYAGAIMYSWEKSDTFCSDALAEYRALREQVEQADAMKAALGRAMAYLLLMAVRPVYASGNGPEIGYSCHLCHAQFETRNGLTHAATCPLVDDPTCAAALAEWRARDAVIEALKHYRELEGDKWEPGNIQELQQRWGTVKYKLDALDAILLATRVEGGTL